MASIDPTATTDPRPASFSEDQERPLTPLPRRYFMQDETIYQQRHITGAHLRPSLPDTVSLGSPVESASLPVRRYYVESDVVEHHFTNQQDPRVYTSYRDIEPIPFPSLLGKPEIKTPSVDSVDDDVSGDECPTEYHVKHSPTYTKHPGALQEVFMEGPYYGPSLDRAASTDSDKISPRQVHREHRPASSEAAPCPPARHQIHRKPVPVDPFAETSRRTKGMDDPFTKQGMVDMQHKAAKCGQSTSRREFKDEDSDSNNSLISGTLGDGLDRLTQSAESLLASGETISPAQKRLARTAQHVDPEYVFRPSVLDYGIGQDRAGDLEEMRRLFGGVKIDEAGSEDKEEVVFRGRKQVSVRDEFGYEITSVESEPAFQRSTRTKEGLELFECFDTVYEQMNRVIEE